MTKSAVEKIFLGGLLACLGIYTVTAMGLRIGTMWEPGPGYLPLVLGGLTFAVCALQLAGSFSRGVKEKISDFTRDGLKRLFVYIATIILFALGFTTLGPAAFFLLLVILAKTSGFQGWGYPVLLAAIFTVITYMTFFNLLLIPLPLGIFEEMWW